MVPLVASRLRRGAQPIRDLALWPRRLVPRAAGELVGGGCDSLAAIRDQHHHVQGVGSWGEGPLSPWALGFIFFKTPLGSNPKWR